MLDLDYAKRNSARSRTECVIALTAAILFALQRQTDSAELELAVLKSYEWNLGAALRCYVDTEGLTQDAVNAVFPDGAESDDVDLKDPFVAQVAELAWVAVAATLRVARPRLTEGTPT